MLAHISIHALREEGDRFRNAERWAARGFLSTPSARRATEADDRAEQEQIISIHALREEGDPGCRPRCRFSKISIHALREEGDYECFKRRIKPNVFLSTPSARRATWGSFSFGRDQEFLSTPSARRATRQLAGNNQAGLISIHALREEGDIVTSVALLTSSKFLSTPSARRATHFCFGGPHCVVISIHALREEGDRFMRLSTPRA